MLRPLPRTCRTHAASWPGCLGWCDRAEGGSRLAGHYSISGNFREFPEIPLSRDYVWFIEGFLRLRDTTTITAMSPLVENALASADKALADRRRFPDAPQFLHFVVRQAHGQWIVTCLDFDLVSQDDTFEDAKRRIYDQIDTYIETAWALDNGIHVEQFLNRKAPLKDWFLFYIASVLHFFHSSFLNIKGYKETFKHQCA